jgi:hypothetical protein
LPAIIAHPEQTSRVIACRNGMKWILQPQEWKRGAALARCSLLPDLGGTIAALRHLLRSADTMRGGKARYAFCHHRQGRRRMTRLQILYPIRLHGLTEAQAHALAALIWGAGQ